MIAGVFTGIALATLMFGGAVRADSPTYNVVQAVTGATDDIRNTLNEMSKNGWVLDHTMGNFLIFKK
jgi:hypothetical protein